MYTIDYEKHSMLFFKGVDKLFIIESETYLYQMAEHYVNENTDFKLKDHVEIGTLLSTLADKGFLKFNGYDSRHQEKTLLTETGGKYLDSLQNTQ